MTLPPTARQTVFPFVAYVFPAPVLSQQPGLQLLGGDRGFQAVAGDDSLGGAVANLWHHPLDDGQREMTRECLYRMHRTSKAPFQLQAHILSALAGMVDSEEQALRTAILLTRPPGYDSNPESGLNFMFRVFQVRRLSPLFSPSLLSSLFSLSLSLSLLLFLLILSICPVVLN